MTAKKWLALAAVLLAASPALARQEGARYHIPGALRSLDLDGPALDQAEFLTDGTIVVHDEDDGGPTVAAREHE